MKNKTLVKYEDGSEFTLAHMGVAIGLGALGAAVYIVTREAVSTWRDRRRVEKAIAVLKKMENEQ